ncbi:MAG: hypothetical protein QXQ53_05770 [Candidatus Methanosuratincola sp.]
MRQTKCVRLAGAIVGSFAASVRACLRRVRYSHGPGSGTGIVQSRSSSPPIAVLYPHPVMEKENR